MLPKFTRLKSSSYWAVITSTGKSDDRKANVEKLQKQVQYIRSFEASWGADDRCIGFLRQAKIWVSPTFWRGEPCLLLVVMALALVLCGEGIHMNDAPVLRLKQQLRIGSWTHRNNFESD